MGGGRKGELSYGLLELGIMLAAIAIALSVLSLGKDTILIFFAEEGQSSLANLKTLGATVGEVLLDNHAVSAKSVPFFLDKDHVIVGFSKGVDTVQGACGSLFSLRRPSTCPKDSSCLCIYPASLGKTKQSMTVEETPTCLPPLKTVDDFSMPDYTIAGFQEIKIKPEEAYLYNFAGIVDTSHFPAPLTTGGYLASPADAVLFGQCRIGMFTDTGDPEGLKIKNLYVEKLQFRDKTRIFIAADRPEERKRFENLRVLYALDVPDFETYLLNKQYEKLFSDAGRFFELRKSEKENVAAIHIILARALAGIATQPSAVITEHYPKLGRPPIEGTNAENPAAVAYADAFDELLIAYTTASPGQQSTTLTLGAIIAQDTRSLTGNTPALQLLRARIKDLEAKTKDLKGGSESADYLLASLAFDKKQWNDAATRFGTFVTTYPTSKQRIAAHFRLGFARAMSGNHLGAIAAYSIVVRESPIAELRVGEEVFDIALTLEHECADHVLDDSVFLSCHALVMDSRIGKEAIRCPPPTLMPLSGITCMADRCEAAPPLASALTKAKNSASVLGDRTEGNPNAHKLLITEAVHTYDREEFTFKRGQSELGKQPTCNTGHIAGTAIDVTLEGKNMGQEAPSVQNVNRMILRTIMCDAGFLPVASSFGHFEYGTPAWTKASTGGAHPCATP